MSSFQFPSNHSDALSRNEATSSDANQDKREGIDADQLPMPMDASKNKRPADYTVSQYEKEKCRRIANDLFAKTEKFLYPATREGGNEQITDSSGSSLSSARVSEPLVVDSSSRSNTVLVQEKFNQIMNTMKDFEHKFQSFKEHVESTASSFIDAHSKQLPSSSSQTLHHSTENTTIDAAHDPDHESSHQENSGTVHVQSMSLSSHSSVSVGNVSEFPVPVSVTFTAPSIPATLARPEESSNQHGKPQ